MSTDRRRRACLSHAIVQCSDGKVCIGVDLGALRNRIVDEFRRYGVA